METPQAKRLKLQQGSTPSAGLSPAPLGCAAMVVLIHMHTYLQYYLDQLAPSCSLQVQQQLLGSVILTHWYTAAMGHCPSQHPTGCFPLG